MSDVARKTYRVTAERDGKLWYVEVDGVGVTQGRNLPDVEFMARDLVAIKTDTDPDSFDLDVSVVIPPSAQAKLDEAASLRERAASAQADAAASIRAAAGELQAAGMTMRDIGQVLGVSYQRAHQLVHG